MMTILMVFATVDSEAQVNKEYRYMRDDDYIKMCTQDFSANSRETNDNTKLGIVICGVILIIFIALAFLIK
jgi:hypothetical protein